MKNNYTYQITNFFIYILLIGQLWSSVFSYANLYFDDTINYIEITSTESDPENENKEENKKKFEDKIEFFNLEISLYFSNLIHDFIYKDDLFPINYLAINIPPPKLVS